MGSSPLQDSDTTMPLRVRFSDGGSFHTSAASVSDYIFNPVFMSYVILCVILFAALMQPTATVTLGLIAHMLLGGAVFTSSLIWLVVSIRLNMFLVNRGYLTSVFTPALLIPLAAINTLLIDFIMLQFGAAYDDATGSMLEVAIRVAVILVCFDIIHGRYVAPQHPSFVPRRQSSINDHQRHELVGPQSEVKLTDQYQSLPSTAKPLLQDTGPGAFSTSKHHRAQKTALVEIGSRNFDPAAILWIKSEDHYLRVQLSQGNVMVRGKLSATVKKLDGDLGMQINRSIWIAFSSIQRIEDQSPGYLDVHLKDETSHRVANSRRLVFKQNFGEFKTRCHV